MHRCPIHGCDTTDNVPTTMGENEANLLVDLPEADQTIPLLFPSSMEVCDTGVNSALNNFNPLIESEPNLILGDHETRPNMTDQNIEDAILSQLDMIADAETKRWSVPVRNLSLEEVEFLSGPKLLPNLATPSLDHSPCTTNYTRH